MRGITELSSAAQGGTVMADVNTSVVVYVGKDDCLRKFLLMESKPR